LREEHQSKIVEYLGDWLVQDTADVHSLNVRVVVSREAAQPPDFFSRRLSLLFSCLISTSPIPRNTITRTATLISSVWLIRAAGSKTASAASLNVA
jgi:hypothetical protein